MEVILRNALATQMDALHRDMTEALEVVAAICPTTALWLDVYAWAPELLVEAIPAQRQWS